MKNLYSLFFLSLLMLCYSCNDNGNVVRVDYLVNKPVYMSASDFRAKVKITVPEPITKQGKICFYEGFLFVSAPQEGIHVIDNRNPASPKNVAYIELLGSADISVRENILYADSYIDLVWFDISNPSSPQLKGRLENAFPHALPIICNQYGYHLNDYDKSKVIVGWELEEEYYEYRVGNGDLMNEMSGGNTSKAGSLSRFTIYKDYLYAVINNQLHILNISSGQPVLSTDPIYVGWNVETIFSYKECMFFGTPTGMIIYSVKNPLKPEFQSIFQHIYGCDPVVVENDLAYVTVWSGNLCGQSLNELFIVDVSNVKQPKQIVSYTMKQPKGLGIDNGTLFVCDDGLKIFDAADPQKIMSNVLAHYKGMDGYDVIPLNNTLMMIADDGLYQYDYSDLKNIKQLSKLSIAKAK